MLNNKNIVITGAASGIGLETAKICKQMGATVIGLDRNKPTEYTDIYVAVDLSDPVAIDNCIKDIPAGIDALCNVAGLPPTAGRIPVLTVNVLGLQRLTLGLIDKLNDNASIVNVASLAGAGWPGAVEAIKKFQSQGDFDQFNATSLAHTCDELEVDDARSYFLSKEVLIAWTMQNRWTWRDCGIRMNTVSPGPVDTPILKDFLETLGERAEEDMKVMDRAGTPQDIAPLIAFLASEQSRWIRGTNIACDGGMHSHIMANMNGL